MAVRFDPDRMAGRRSWAAAQRRYAGQVLEAVGVVDIGWHDTATHPETGAFALVAGSAGLDRLFGEILRVRVGRREAFVYVLGAGAVPTPISLSRRAFFSLGLLSEETLSATVEVVA